MSIDEEIIVQKNCLKLLITVENFFTISTEKHISTDAGNRWLPSLIQRVVTNEEYIQNKTWHTHHA